jgi:uncharacterized protein YeeX (DUF496 family)
MRVTVYPLDYDKRMEEYNKKVAEIEKQREEFYEKNPDFWSKNMFLNVIAPPQKLVITEY